MSADARQPRQLTCSCLFETQQGKQKRSTWLPKYKHSIQSKCRASVVLALGKVCQRASLKSAPKFWSGLLDQPFPKCTASPTHHAPLISLSRLPREAGVLRDIYGTAAPWQAVQTVALEPPAPEERPDKWQTACVCN